MKYLTWQRSLQTMVLVATVSLVGCGDDGGNGGQPDANNSDSGMACSTEADVQAVFSANGCATSTCHDDSSPSSGLDLLSAGLETRLSGVSSDDCVGEVFVTPGVPASSYLLDKVNAAPSCGARMPLGGAALSTDDIQCISDWISGL